MHLLHIALGYGSWYLHVRSTSYRISEGGKQLLHFTSLGCTPLHFNFLYSRKWSKEIWAASEIYYLSRQWQHFAFGPCWHNHFIFVSLLFSSTVVQFRHLPPGPWLQPKFYCFFYSVFYLPSFEVLLRQFRHLPPGGWLHFDERTLFLKLRWKYTPLRLRQLHETPFCWVLELSIQPLQWLRL